MRRRFNNLQKIRYLIGGLSLAAILYGCTAIRANNERFYYRQVLWELIEIPDSTKEKCQYDYEAPYPAFIADENLATDFDKEGLDRKKPHLDHGFAIHYNPVQMEKIRHESTHYLNRMKRSNISYLMPNGVTAYEKVSWDCLDEISAQLMADNLKLRDLLRAQKTKTRKYRHTAGFR